MHPTAVVETADIGSRTTVWAFAHVMKGAVVGSDCNIGDHAFIEGGARVGNYVTIKNNNLIWDGITIEDGVFLGPGVIFTNDRFPRSSRMPGLSDRYDDDSWLLPTLVKQGATIGAGSVIAPGLIIGRSAMIGAGATVTTDVADHAIVVGSPARRVGWACTCGVTLIVVGERSECRCGRAFDLSTDQVKLIG